MAKLSQIAFDFDAPETPEPVAAPVKAVEAEITAPLMMMEEPETVIDLTAVAAAVPVAVKRKKLHNKKSTRGRMSLKEADAGADLDILKPRKNGKGDRLFRPEDVKNLKLIYHLLRERKYTIEGAKEFLRNGKKADEKFAMIESLKKIKGFLLELKANL
jgi:hypothetical protein